MTDERSDVSALMGRIAAGELEALGDLYLALAPRVLRVLARVFPELSREDVEDLCQEVFLMVPDLSRRYEERGKLESWLIGVALHKARNLRRKRWIRERILREHPDAVPRPTAGQAPDATVNLEGIRKAFLALSPKDREVLVLSVVEGLTASEIGDILGLRPGSVWSRLHRARKALAAALARQGLGEGSK